MKTIIMLLFCVAMLAVLPAALISAGAIGFVAEEMYESVFVIYSGNSMGSGFTTGKNIIITNAHVVDDPDDVIVKDYSGNEYFAFVVGMDREQDIAVLGVCDVEFSYITIEDMRNVNTGDDIYAVGAPKSMEYTLTKGVISAKEREIGGRKYIQIDAAVNEGNSGGPLLNEAGMVIGVNTFKLSDSEGIGLSIPMDRVTEFVASLGIETDIVGNITETVELTRMPENAEEGEDYGYSNDRENNDSEDYSGLTVAACITAGVSVILNIVLVILLVFERKRNLNIKYDPRERTDFDIDILE